MYKVYIIYSNLKDRFYVEFTSDLLEERIRKHNSNHKGFTGHKGDWVLKYFEIYSVKDIAMRREREIKNWKSRKKIVALINLAGLEHSDL